MKERERSNRRGGPLIMIALLIAFWIGGRALWWENPFPKAGLVVPIAAELLADGAIGTGTRGGVLELVAPADLGEIAIGLVTGALPRIQRQVAAIRGNGDGHFEFSSTDRSRGLAARIAGGQQLLWLAALDNSPGTNALQQNREDIAATRPGRGEVSATAPVNFASTASTDRWSLDGWAFWRAGSNATPISQGRVPIYGASQIGANLQFRARPGSQHDPRLFARAYRALVQRGESELALGASARPVPRVPLRFAGELRITDSPTRTALRPAAFAVTELPPVGLPFGVDLEAYAQGGYVGGDAATAFADGQVSVTREVMRFNNRSARPLRLSIGAGAWGGAQEDAERVDIGPTMRLDLAVGKVPARVSVDWRERIGGDAAPVSGVAATLSTRF